MPIDTRQSCIITARTGAIIGQTMTTAYGHLVANVHMASYRRITQGGKEMRYRLLSLLTAFLLAIGFGSFLMAGSASAASGLEYCVGSQCLNAWNGGPDVNAYTVDVDNDTFAALVTGTLANGTYVYGIQFQAGTTYNGDCVSDLGNDSGDARAGLDGNCVDGDIAWGANFTVDYSGCPSGYFGFYDIHWGGWLAPASSGNGAAFYLNNTVEHCFYVYSP